MLTALGVGRDTEELPIASIIKNYVDTIVVLYGEENVRLFFSSWEGHFGYPRDVDVLK